MYFEELKREPNAGFGPKDIFEIASKTAKEAKCKKEIC